MTGMRELNIDELDTVCGGADGDKNGTGTGGGNGYGDGLGAARTLLGNLETIAVVAAKGVANALGL